MSRRLRSFGVQLLLYASGLLLAMGVLVAVLLAAIALEPSAEQMSRGLSVLAKAAEQQLEAGAGLDEQLSEAGAFLAEPAGMGARLPLPFAALLRERLEDRVGRAVQLRHRDDGETVLWLPANDQQAAFGLRYELLRAPVANTSLLVLVVLAIALLLAAWLAARWLAAPLKRLSAALPAMAAGGSAPALGRHATREVVELADALGEAVGRLREQSAAREIALAGISHDLRTPLMRIALLLQWLPEHPRLAEIEAEIAEMDALIASALELARAGRQEAAQWQPLAPLLQRLLVGEADWRCQGADGWQLLAPPIALRRALDNLVQNAQRHGQPPHEVQVRARPDGLDIEISNGVADPALLPDAAQPAPSGGLGLAIVEHLAASFDARLEREMAEGRVCMRLVVPRARARPVQSQQAER